MRRFSQLAVLCFAAGVVTACIPDKVIPTPEVPTAGVRFINAVPDTFGMDMRSMDIVENSNFYNINFRTTTQTFYKAAEAGTRHYRIFTFPPTSTMPADSQQIIASTVMADTTLTLEAGHRYTFIMWGFARPGSSPAMRLTVLDDDPADPASQVALRFINACLPGICGASADGAVDASAYLTTAGVPGTPTWAAVQPLTATPYVLSDTGSVRYNVKPAGGGANLFTDPTAIAGQRADGPGGIFCPPATSGCDRDAIPGTRAPGSAVMGILFPRSVAGSKAANFTTPGMFFTWDRRPPRPAGL